MIFISKKHQTAWILGTLICVLCMMLASPVFAAQVSFLTPATTVNMGQEFEVAVRVDTGGDSINAISGTITFPSGTMQLEEIHTADSIVSLWVTQPHIASDGIVFAGVIPGGFNGKDGSVLTLVFRAINAGNADVTLASTQVLRNDGKGSGVSVTSAPLSLVIGSGNVKVSTPSPGSDTNPPEPFTPQISRDPSIFNGQWFVSFTTTDKGTGVAQYEIKETLSPLLSPFSTWHIAQSPYLLGDQNLTSYVYVRAVDQAGNSRTERINPSHPVPWYEDSNILLALLVVGGSIILGSWLWKRKT